MPRLQPPAGCITAKEAASRLGVNESLLSRYVKEGKLNRYGPPERKHKFYKAREIEALIVAERYVYMPGQWRDNPTSTFGPATEQDIPGVVEISNATFGPSSIPNSVRFAWMSKNPELYFVLRDYEKRTVGFALILPLKHDLIQRFIHDEIEMTEITPDDIQLYEPGNPLHLYIMAVAIDPKFDTRKKHSYGARLVHGMFDFFFDLAERGVDVVSITARSHLPDGIRLLRKMGIPQLHSPVRGKSLFVVNVADSGFPVFERYMEILTRKRKPQSHIIDVEAPTAVETVQSTAPPVETPVRPRRAGKRATEMVPPDLPEGTLTLQQFADEVGIGRSTLLEQVKKHAIDHIAIPKPARPKESERYFTPEQQEAYKQWRADRGIKPTQDALFD